MVKTKPKGDKKPMTVKEILKRGTIIGRKDGNLIVIFNQEKWCVSIAKNTVTRET